MPLTELNHYFVRSKDLERSRHFYCDILGFEEMPRPDFPFPVGLPSRNRYFAQIQLFQIFVTDPDGLTIELNFPDVSTRPEWA